LQNRDHGGCVAICASFLLRDFLAMTTRHRSRRVASARIAFAARAITERLEERRLFATQVVYSFDTVASLGETLADGGTLGGYFLGGGLNNRGDLTVAANIETDADPQTFEGEAVFVRHKGETALTELLRAGDIAPGGGNFGGFNTFGPVSINQKGDVAVAFDLNTTPDDPINSGAGVYRYDAKAGGAGIAVSVAGTTPVPGSTTDKFAGASFYADINNGGSVSFSGLIPATIGPAASSSVGLGIFVADKKGRITKAVAPGDPAPGGKVFDFAVNASINSRKDVAFGAHVEGDEVIQLVPDGGPPLIAVGESVYLRQKNGNIVSIAHQGDAAPGGGTYRLAFGPIVNDKGAVVFIGDLTASPDTGQTLAVYLYNKGATVAIAKPGDTMPGGGHLVTASFMTGNYDLNNKGQVLFNAALDTDADSDGVQDTGLYLWTKGVTTLVARTGTDAGGTIGAIKGVEGPGGLAPDSPTSGDASFNDKGQVLFEATDANGTGRLLLGTPRRVKVTAGPGSSISVSMLHAPSTANAATTSVSGDSSVRANILGCDGDSDDGTDTI
jgi:hypothetical protein